MTTTPPTEEVARARLHYTEAIAPGLRMQMDLRRIIAAAESDYQKVEVLETIFGKVS
jgi:spermidine synthase